MERQDIVAELLDNGGWLWSRVECDVSRGRVVVYARLRAEPPLGVRRALAESERVFKAVLEPHLQGQKWLAAVQWSERLCRTFAREPAVAASAAELATNCRIRK